MKVYIVAPDHAEARLLAQRYELGYREWRWVHSHHDLMGLRRPAVIQASCFGRRNPHDVEFRRMVYQQYDITEARVVIVPCRIKRED